MTGQGQSVVPTIISTQWMNNIRSLGLISQKELCECENYARTQPFNLVALLNTIFYQRRSQIPRDLDGAWKGILMNIGRYISSNKKQHQVTAVTEVINIPMKIISWRQDILRITNHPTVQRSIFQQLINIINSAGTAADCFPIIREITTVVHQVPQAVRTDIFTLLTDIKRAALKKKISYLLAMHDNIIQQDIKVKLS